MDAPSTEELARRVAALDGIDSIRARLRDHRAYLVGGVVRDLLLGRDRGDIDIAVEGDAIAAAQALAAAESRSGVVLHHRFRTAAVAISGHSVDLATARAESYSRPGALPVTRPASLADDLGRRDFTVNAMAIALAEPEVLIDPHDGLADLGARRLRVLHPESFRDDPTRALRASRYAARLGFELDPETRSLVSATDLNTVSQERVEAELRLLATEPDPGQALHLAIEWGLARGDLAQAVAAMEQTQRPGWDGVGDQHAAFLAGGEVAAGGFRAGPSKRMPALLLVAPDRPSTCVAAARGADGVDLAIACSRGADWVDLYVRDWRHVRLEISGRDLISAGLDPGPPLGKALGAVLAAKLDGEVAGRPAELALALAIAQAEPGPDPRTGGSRSLASGS